MTDRVVVIGGGYGGIVVARALDQIADVVLVEPRDQFVHNVAALRAVVEPDWTDRLFLPYDRLLRRGRVIRERAIHVDAGTVTLGSGAQVRAAYTVLATGSTYPFPAKMDVEDSAMAATRIRAVHQALAHADRVLLLGAGPVGLEFAGEIASAWPAKTVTIVDPAGQIASGGLPDEFRVELRRQLDALGVHLLLGTSLREPPPVDSGEPATFTAVTRSGTTVTADIWFRCFGAAPVTDYLASDLMTARQPDGYLRVDAQLRLAGQERVFAIGDITAIPEAKMAKAAEQHADVVAANIRTLLQGGGGAAATHTPNRPSISLPLGPSGGASYRLDTGVLGADETARLKGADMKITTYLHRLGLTPTASTGSTAHGTPETTLR